MFWALFILIAVLLIAVYLLMPTPQTDTPEAAGLDDFTFPTNSNLRAVPILYGTVWLPGNIIEYSDLRSREIEACN